MVKYYFIILNNEQEGPFTIEELAAKRLLNTTQIWCEGMESWAEASAVEELRDICIAAPPIFQPDIIKGDIASEIIPGTPHKHQEKYEANYPRHTGLVWLAIALLSIIMIIYFAGGISFSSDYEGDRQMRVIISAVMRIIVAIIVVDNAGQLNRDKSAWGVFAFILPIPALIALGLSRKLKVVPRVMEGVSDSEQCKLWLSEAVQLKESDRINDALIYLDEILNLDAGYSPALFEKAMIYYKQEKYDKASNLLSALVSNREYKGEALYYLGVIEMIDGKVDSAVKYWEEAVLNGVEEADRFILRYKTLRGVYLLHMNEALQKVENSNGSFEYIIKELKYVRGLASVDSIGGNINKTLIDVYALGVIIRINTLPRHQRIAINYYEMKDIDLSQNEQELNIVLDSGETIQFKIKKRLQSTEYGFWLTPLLSHFEAKNCRPSSVANKISR
jgi:tetratricopeptide (TPR) repeat protein